MNILFEFGITYLAWLLLAVPVALACALAWLLLPALRRGVLPRQRDRAMPWSGMEVMLAFFVWLMLQSILVTAAGLIFGEEPDEKYYRQYAAGALASAGAVVAAIVLMHAISGTRLYQLGLHAGRWRQGLLLGALIWLVVHPLVQGLYLIVVGLHLEFVGELPKDHDLVKLMRNEMPELEWTLLLSVALVLGPLLEEFLFRGVVQRWAGTLVWRSYLVVAWAIVAAILLHPETYVEMLLFVLVLLPGFQLCPLVSDRLLPFVGPQLRRGQPYEEELVREGVSARPTGSDYREEGIKEGPPPRQLDDRTVEDPPPRVPDWVLGQTVKVFDPSQQDRRVNQPRAVYAAAVMFAVFHSWPAPIPLFVLGLVLGWLACRTQSLLPSFVVHMLFNAAACIEVALRLPMPE